MDGTLKKVLEGASPEDRERAVEFFSAMARGNPDSFPVQLALVTRMAAEALAEGNTLMEEALETFDGGLGRMEAAARDMKKTEAAAALSAETSAKSAKESRAAEERAERSAEKTREDVRVVEEVKSLLGENALRMHLIQDRLDKIMEFNLRAAWTLLLIGLVLGAGLMAGYFEWFILP